MMDWTTKTRCSQDDCHLFGKSSTLLLFKSREELCVLQLLASAVHLALLCCRPANAALLVPTSSLLSRLQPPLISYPVDLDTESVYQKTMMLNGVPCAKVANFHFGKKWHCDHYKQLPENSSSACTEAFIYIHYSHLLAGASKQSWDASIAVTIAFLIHKVHLGTNTFSLSANVMCTKWWVE